MDAVMKNDFAPNDWIKMVGPGFDIYGKVVARDPKDGQIRIITSTIYNKKMGPENPSNEIRFVRINKEEVPQRARLNVLNRISNPRADPPDTNPYSRRRASP